MSETETQIEQAIRSMEFAICASKRGGQGGDKAVLKYSRAFRAHDDLVALLTRDAEIFRQLEVENRRKNFLVTAAECKDQAAKIDAAIAKARGEQP